MLIELLGGITLGSLILAGLTGSVLDDIDKLRLKPRKLITGPYDQSTVDGATFVDRSPAALLEEAQRVDPSITDTEYALARLVASEGYSGPDSQRTRALYAICESAIYRASVYKITPGQMLRQSNKTAAAGHYGQQSGRWASTAHDPDNYHLSLARLCLYGFGPDIVRSAKTTAFVDLSLMDGKQAGQQLMGAYNLAKQWHDDGYELVAAPGVDAWHTSYWRRQTSAARLKANWEVVKRLFAAHGRKIA